MMAILSKIYCARRFVLLIMLSLFACLAGCEATTGGRSYQVKYYYTQTEDGITLALRRYQPEKIEADKLPVILCHGLSYNLMFWDLDEKVSLPRYLARNGYDVWSLSLRGACPSGQPVNSFLRKIGRFNLDPQVLLTLKKRSQDVKMIDWSVDDHITKDVPVAIRFVCKTTEKPSVHWIGHSMGGMVMFGYLGTQPAEVTQQVKSFVAISVPMAEFHPLNEPFQFLLNSETAIDIGSRIVGSSTPATFGTIFGDLGTPTDKLFYNGQNIDDGVLRLLFHTAEEEISPGQLKQLLNMVRTERFHSLDQKTDYTAKLSEVTTPVYCMVGTVDNMATPGAVQYEYREIASRDKKFSMFGRVNSQKNDYGHDDIVIGKYAQKEVYPKIRQWLNAHPMRLDQSPLMLQPTATEDAKP